MDWSPDVQAGRVFSATSAAAGVVLPIYSNTAQIVGLWNPGNSGVNCFIISVALTYVDTTGAATGFVLGINKSIGSSLATGGISAFTAAAPDRALGGTGGNRVLCTTSAATTIAPTLWRSLGINQLVLTATDTATPPDRYRAFDGDCVVPPNNAIWLGGNIAQLSKWVATICWSERPVQ